MCEKANIIYINTNEVINNVQLMENGNLAIKYNNGKTIEGLKPRRLFPLSLKHRQISLIDSNGDEVGILPNICNLDRESRKNIISALNRFYLIPEIVEIYKIEEKYGIFRWYVRTDKGDKNFEVLNNNTDISCLGNGHYIIKDSDDNRYEVKNLKKLDITSRKHMEEQL